MTDWQPISTAPKDGTVILACGPSVNVDFFHWQDLEVRNAPVGWRDSFIHVYPEDHGKITHWMPIPARPQFSPPSKEPSKSQGDGMSETAQMLAGFGGLFAVHAAFVLAINFTDWFE